MSSNPPSALIRIIKSTHPSRVTTTCTTILDQVGACLLLRRPAAMAPPWSSAHWEALTSSSPGGRAAPWGGPACLLLCRLPSRTRRRQRPCVVPWSAAACLLLCRPVAMAPPRSSAPWGGRREQPLLPLLLHARRPTLAAAPPPYLAADTFCCCCSLLGGRPLPLMLLLARRPALAVAAAPCFFKKIART